MTLCRLINRTALFKLLLLGVVAVGIFRLMRSRVSWNDAVARSNITLIDIPDLVQLDGSAIVGLFEKRLSILLQRPNVELDLLVGTLANDTTWDEVTIDRRWLSKSKDKFVATLSVNRSSVTLTMSASSTQPGISCYKVEWRHVLKSRRYLIDCYSAPAVGDGSGDSHWYGGPEVLQQKWPIDGQRSELQLHETGDYLLQEWRNRPSFGKYGSIAEPYWVTSTGVGIFVVNGGGVSGLRSGFNEDGRGFLCVGPNPMTSLKSSAGRRRSSAAGDDETFSYHICRGDNVLHVHQVMSAMFIKRPVGTPHLSMIRQPIWSTWARYKHDVNRSLVINMADEIVRQKFPQGQLEIDDSYTVEYGDFEFNTIKFPDPADLINKLHDMGFRVTSWVHPFASPRAKSFLEGKAGGYWIAKGDRDDGHDDPAEITWWRGKGYIIDVANEAAVRWYVNRLRQFQRRFKIDSFKFDAGEVNYVPVEWRRKHRSTSGSESFHQNDYSTLYANMAAQFGTGIEIRSAFGNQALPVFVRMLDKDSVWSHANGLRSVIPTAFSMGLAGYPFILPDMIGGNGYLLDTATSNVPSQQTSFAPRKRAMPDRELYIRWLELTTFLPAMQFSYVPWQFDAETVEIARKYTVEVRQSLVNDAIERAANQSVSTGSPIIRPLWWLDPTDEDSLVCDSEFLIGDQLLVAPVLVRGARSRDVYFPGKDISWRQLLPRKSNDAVVSGRNWVREVKLNLDEIAVYERVTKTT